MKLFKTVIYFFLVSIICTNIWAEQKEITVYTSRFYRSDALIYEAFYKQYGIRVKVLNFNPNKILDKLDEAVKNNKIDVLLTADVITAIKAKQKGYTTAIRNKNIVKSIPANFRDKNNIIIPITKIPRIIVYNSDLEEAQAITSYNDLEMYTFKNKITLRSYDNIFNMGLISYLVQLHSSARTKVILENVTDNLVYISQGNDRAQLRLVGKIPLISMVNATDLALMINSKDKVERRYTKYIKVIFPNQQKKGTFVNMATASLLASSKHKEYSRLFIAFLLSTPIQKHFVDSNYEYPIIKGVTLTKTQAEWGEFKEDFLSLSKGLQHYKQANSLVKKQSN